MIADLQSPHLPSLMHRQMKEGHSKDNITVRWDWGVNHKRTCYFYFPKDDTELRCAAGCRFSVVQGSGTGVHPDLAEPHAMGTAVAMWCPGKR